MILDCDDGERYGTMPGNRMYMFKTVGSRAFYSHRINIGLTREPLGRECSLYIVKDEDLADQKEMERNKSWLRKFKLR